MVNLFFIVNHCLKADHAVLVLQASRKLEEMQKHVSSRKVRYYVSPVSLKALQQEMGLTFDHTDHNLDVNEEDEVEEDLNMT